MDPQAPQPPFDPNRPYVQTGGQGQPSVTDQSLTARTQPSGVTSTPEVRGFSANSSKKSKKGLFIAIGLAVVVVFFLLGAVLIANSKPKTAKKAATTDTATVQQSLQPATAIDVEQTNNALSQDLSGLDDEKDYPAASLEDKTLGL